MSPISFSDRYWFVKLTIGIIALAAVVIGALFLIKSCAQEPHTHTESEQWIIKKAADCTHEGARYKVCTGCGEQMNYEIIPANGHKSVEKKENVVDSTCTKKGSYVSVHYCSVCKEVLSREDKVIELKDHKADSPVSENIVSATCTKYGSHDEVVYCSTCPEDNRYEISREEKIDNPTGHIYNLKAIFDPTDNAVKIEGTCTENCGENNYKYYFTTENSGLKITRDNSYSPCCGGEKHFTLEMTYRGKNVVLYYNGPVESHKIYSYPVVIDGKMEKGYVSLDQYLVKNPDGTAKKHNDQSYFDYNAKTTFAGVDYYLRDYVVINPDTCWDDEGFGFGSLISCAQCADEGCDTCNGTYIMIQLYNKSKDKTP